MSNEQKLMQQAKVLLQQRGEKGLRKAQETIYEEKISANLLQEVLHYFMDEVWFDVLHPALLSLACEAVGGKPEDTTDLGAALVLLAGAADIHDDIIDQSPVKSGKQTVFGKFGKDLAVLAGDTLLLKGLYLLFNAVKLFPADRQQEIMDLIKHSFYEISNAEAKEAILRGKTDITGKEYLEAISKKTAVSEATAKIGAILGNGSTQEVEILGNYGQVFGTLFMVRDEFVDVFEPDELRNRVQNECLPLPVLLAFQDPQSKTKILQLLSEELTEEAIERILDLTMNSLLVQAQVKTLHEIVYKESIELGRLKGSKAPLEFLLKALLEDL